MGLLRNHAALPSAKFCKVPCTDWEAFLRARRAVGNFVFHTSAKSGMRV
jgi:hypothetical protein